MPLAALRPMLETVMTLRILLVDDSRVFAVTAMRALDALPGAAVVGVAHDGCDALAQAALLQPDLMLLDIGLPDMSGLEVARRLRMGSHVPRMVFVSFHDSSVYREAALALGAEGFIGKTDFTAKLLPMVRRMAALAATQDEAIG